LFNTHDLEEIPPCSRWMPSTRATGRPLVGREAAVGCYQPVSDYRRAVDVGVLHGYAIGGDVAGGFVDVTFRDPGGPGVPLPGNAACEW
jgi:hypothetical protein